MDQGFDALMVTLAEVGAGGLPLPGVDEPMLPATYVRAILGASRDEGRDFDTAWAAAINRLQPPAGEDAIVLNSADELALRHDRAMLEESRGYFRAAFEQRRRDRMEASQSYARGWKRDDESRNGGWRGVST